MDIRKYVENRQQSEVYEFFKYGEDYFVGRNSAIMDREKKVFVEGLGVKSNPFGANHKLPSGFFKKIVMQKVGYLLGNGVMFAEKGQTEALDDYFDTSFDEFVIDAGVDASKFGEAWALGYVDGNKLLFSLIPAKQLTPIYDEYGKLVKMIRMYQDNDLAVMLEYDVNEIKRYEKKSDGSDYEFVGTLGHYTEVLSFNGKMVGDAIEHGFGVVPFIPLFNNKEQLSDLYPIKPLIDTYDIIFSDFANNIDDMQDAFFTLKGFQGDEKTLSKFVQQLKQYKAVPYPEDGEIGTHQLNIPVEAREKFLGMLQRDIYDFAMAVDLKNVGGGSITNVHIKAMFGDLDLKCNDFENQVRKFIYGLLDFVNEFDGKKFTTEFNFERSLIVNRQEMVETLIKLSGILSLETIRELLPYEIDIEQEKKRLESEMGVEQSFELFEE